MSIFYTADPHFGHGGIIRLCNRPFASVEEMNETLVANWNARVREEDTVYIVGDFWYKGTTPAIEYLKRLRGKKFLIRGNHDEWLNAESGKYLVGVSNLHFIHDTSCGGHSVVLCHYPLADWPGNDSYMIYGHIHNQKNMPYSDFLNSQPRLLNAGVEINGYQPVTLAELIANNNAHRE